ncbi:MAG: deoxyribodipyrimidine photolyase [Oleispira sp.]|jgi:deoxyribodipyrimidine photolyase
MLSIGLVISIAVPILILLVIAVFVSKQQQKNTRQKSQIRAVKEYIEELAEALEFLVKVDDQKEIQELVFSRIKQLNGRYVSFFPKKEQARASAVELDALQKQVVAGGKKKQVLKSDREIRFAKKQFSKVLRSFGPMIKNKTASEAAILGFRRYLRISILEMEVDSFSAQGDVAAQRGDVMTASGYYKAARKILIDFNMQFPEKNQRIRELAKKTALLFNGDQSKGGSLADELSKEETEKDEHGFSLDPRQDTKQNF